MVDDVAGLPTLEQYRAQLRYPDGRKPCRRTLLNWENSGKLKIVRLGNLRFVDVAGTAEALLQKNQA